jgi:dTDP-4-amino-4,6-dideoxygalactose transaminase
MIKTVVPMIDLKRQYEDLKEELAEALAVALESTRYVLGPGVEELERKVADYMGVGHAVGVASGTDALHLAMKSLGIGEGDEVITTPFTFFATVEAILYVGATPVFVDIEPETFNIDPHRIEEKITGRTKAIMPVHIFGHPAGMGEIMDTAHRHGLSVVEDCAQAFGASLGGTRAGAFGEMGCFSFYPSKNLGAYGDAGMVVLRDGGMASEIRKIRNHGSQGGYIHEIVGMNSRLDELQAAVLLVKMKRIDAYNEARRRNARLYTGMLSGKVRCPVEKEGCVHVYHQYTITSPVRDRIQERLMEAGIASTVYYPVPLHLQPALGYMGHGQGDFPVAERAANEVLSLPMYPELEQETIGHIAEIVLSV